MLSGHDYGLAGEGEGVQKLKGLGDIKCMGFSRNGRLLAVGCEDSSLHIMDWPSLVMKKHIRWPSPRHALLQLVVQSKSEAEPGCLVHRGKKDALRDLDFSSVHGDKASLPPPAGQMQFLPMSQSEP